MAFDIQSVVSDGISVAASRNGAVLALFFFLAESLGILLFLVAGTMYVPVDVGTGLGPSPDLAASGDLPQTATSIATMLSGVFTSIVTIPISIVAIRTFVGGERDKIPDAYMFGRIGRATLSGIVANFLYGLLLFTITFGTGVVILLSIIVLNGSNLIPESISGIVFLVGALILVLAAVVLTVVVWLHFLFLLHEIAVRHRGILGAFKGSWATVRGARLKIGGLALVLVVARVSVGWAGAPPADGNWSVFQIIVTPISLVLSSIVGVFVVAILAQAYRELRPDVPDDFL
jgi:hypothetical protein